MRVRPSASPFCALALWLLAAAPAAAQVSDPAATAVFRKGPLAFTPSLTFPAIGVDSNVLNTSEAPESDFVVNAQPLIEMWLRVGRFRLDARQQVNILYFRDHEDERALDRNTSLRVNLTLHRLMLYAGAAQIKTTDKPTVEINSRVKNTTTPFTAGTVINIGAKTVVDVGADYQTAWFDEDAVYFDTPLKGLLDRSTATARTTLSYTLKPPTSLTLSATHEDARFPRDATRNSTSLRIMPGIAFSPFTLITGKAEAGMLWYTPRDPTVAPFRGLTARVDVGYVLFGNTRLGLQVGREARPSIDAFKTYFIQSSLSAMLTHRFTSRWDITLGSDFQHLDYGETAVLTLDGPPPPRDRIEGYSASIGLQLNRGLRLGIRGQLARRYSNRPKNSYEGTRITSMFTYGFQ